MESLMKLFRNFWVCLGFSVFSLLALYAAVLDESGVWIGIDAFCVVYWVHAAYRSIKPTHIDDIPLTDDQMRRIRQLTRTFSREMEAIVNEVVKDESNNGKDKETDKKEPSDE